ncbi:MAG: DHA2 family efflux MFS transporter permease subunit [Sphingomonadales bacterium]|nr:DHA2 family efflux MFS transporter permease subunit [Sphingomonadales bacterium]
MTAPHLAISKSRRTLITCSVMLSTMIVALDGTIANVALPHMQASLLASPEQVVWVLTSYLVASAIAMPLSGWLASRYGRKLVMVASAAGFTLASVSCGLSTSLGMMVVSRLLQGAFGAGLVPLGQATLLDVYPPERQGQAMVIAGLGAMIGPLSGPTLGGWLTDAFNWRWIFMINVPIGLAAMVGLWSTLPETRNEGMAKFDLFGFATVSIFIGTLQLMMDRGQQLDWFESREICIEAAAVAVFLWMSVVHMLTARDTFVSVDVFRDRNFTIGTVISAAIGILIFASVPIIVVMQQQLLGYSAYYSGLVSLPRGFGTVFGLLVVGRLMGRVDERVLLLAGLAMLSLALWMLSRLSLQTDATPLLITAGLQGMGGGLMIAPLSAISYSTLALRLRNEGAALYALARSIGQSLGLSALQALSLRNAAQVSSRLVEGVIPSSATLAYAAPGLRFDEGLGLRALAGEAYRQAAMVATIDSMWLILLLALAMMPLILLMQRRGAVTAR